MSRKIFSVVLTVLFLAAVDLAAAQQPKKVPRIGYLSGQDPATESTRAEAVRLAPSLAGCAEPFRPPFRRNLVPIPKHFGHPLIRGLSRSH